MEEQEKLQQEKKDYSKYDDQKYDYAVGMLKSQSKINKMPKWLQTVLAWLVGLVMVALWLFAFAWSQAL